MKKTGNSGLFATVAVTLAAVVILTGVDSMAAEARRVLPLKVICEGLGDGQTEQYTQAIIKKLIRYPEVRLMPVPGSDPLDIMLDAGCEDLDDACLRTIGENARADDVLLVEVTAKAGKFKVAAKFVSVSGTKSLAPETLGNSEDQLGQMLVDTLEKVFGPEPAPEPVLAPVVETVGFRIETDPAGADVYVDDEFSGMTPRSVPLNPGEHWIRVKKTGYIEKGQKLNVDVVNMKGVSWKLEPIEKPVAVAPILAPAAVVAPTPAPAAAPAVAPAPVVAPVKVAEPAPAVAPAPAPVPASEPVVAAAPAPAKVPPSTPAVVKTAPPAPVEAKPPVAALTEVPPVDQGVPEEPEPEVKKDPFYKTWWFWTIIGVAVVGAGTVAGILASQGDSQQGAVEFSPWGNYAPLDVTLYPRSN